MIDVQNVTNHLNDYGFYYFYDEDKNTVEKDTWYHTGLFPIFNYRIEF